MKLLFITLLTIISISANAQIPSLNSYDVAPGTVYLDFDGQYIQSAVWNGGNGLQYENPNISNATITEVFKRVSEDFKIFKLNITTDSTVYLAAPATQRIRVIVTPTRPSGYGPGTSGIAYMSSFVWGDNTPAFVFVTPGSADVKFIAEAISHETGHSLGCAHQSVYDNNCVLIDGYNPGQGSGEIGWAPIMGYPVDKKFTTWNNQKRSTSCSDQDDIFVISSRITGGGLREDDIANNTIDATPITLTDIHLNANGIINGSSDVDMFRLDVTAASKLKLLVAPPADAASENYGNVDIMVRLLNSAGTTIRVYNNLDSVKVRIDTTLATGIYYLSIDGTGNINTPSDYGSSGSYALTGTLQTLLSLPLQRLDLRGTVNNQQHIISWIIEADEPVTKSVIEYSGNGNSFQTLQDVDYRANSYSYKAFTDHTVYYRMKAFLRNGSFKTSNVVALQSAKTTDKVSVLNNVVNDLVLVSVTENRNYEIYDANGRMLRKGLLVTNNMNQINIADAARGIYFLKTYSSGSMATHRLMKN